MSEMPCKIGFTCGSFDLLHAGHILMLEEAKRQCDHLIVGLQSDPSIDRPDKNKPIQSVEERKIVLRGIKWVDEVREEISQGRLLIVRFTHTKVHLALHCVPSSPGRK